MKQDIDNQTTECIPLPTLTTQRLTLRPFVMSDADRVQQLLQEKAIAANTRTIDHPYPDGAAQDWIAKHQSQWESGLSAIFALELHAKTSFQTAAESIDVEGNRESGPSSDEGLAVLVGACGLEIKPADENAELGYWIGKPYWGQGYASEAAARVLRFGFEQLGLYRIHACHMTHNPASGRVLEKIGMQREGRLRGHMKKWGVFHDVVVFGALRDDRPDGF